jgi:hypothetical protein
LPSSDGFDLFWPRAAKLKARCSRSSLSLHHSFIHSSLIPPCNCHCTFHLRAGTRPHSAAEMLTIGGVVWCGVVLGEPSFRLSPRGCPCSKTPKKSTFLFFLAEWLRRFAWLRRMRSDPLTAVAVFQRANLRSFRITAIHN